MNYNKIKLLCVEREISIDDLSKKIGMSKAGLYTSMTNNSLKIENLEKIASALNVPISYFFDTDENGQTGNIVPLETVNVYKTRYEKQKTENEYLKREIEHLKDKLADKEKLIKLLEKGI